MRQKVFIALAREARAFAEQNNRTTNVVTVVYHSPRFLLQPLEELARDGTVRYQRIPFQPETVYLSDGPRMFKQQLKRAYRRGLLMG